MAKIESDEALVRRFHAGDDAAFDRLCERYRKSVYTSCYAILVGEQRATDVASQTFTEAMRELRDGHVPADLHLWLRAKARRLAIDRADPRMERRSRSVEIDPEWQVAVGERGQLVWDAVTSLSLSHRKVLSLRIPLELTTQQIAENLNIDQSTAQRLLDDADRELRAALVALIVARSARRECTILDGLLTADGWTAGHFRAESRTYRTVADHIDGCKACIVVKNRTYLASNWLRIVIPLLAVPEELIRRILEETQEMTVRATSEASTASAVTPTSMLSPTSALTSTGASIGQPLNKLTQLAQSGRAAISTTATRVAASPTFTKVVHTVHENPVIARTAGLAASLVLLGPLVLVGSQHRPDPSGPTTQAEPPPATASPSPGAGSPSDPTAEPPPPGSPNSDPANYTIPRNQSAVITVPPDPPPPGTKPPAAPNDATSNPPPSSARTSRPVTSSSANEPPPAASPPRWGYAWSYPGFAAIGAETRIGTIFGGSWRTDPNPAIAGRFPMLRHEAVGVYRMLFPGIGSEKGIAQVSVAWGAAGYSCVIRDLQNVGGDEVVHVHCFDIYGAPREANFAVLFAEAASGSQPMATVHYDGSGVTNSRTVNALGGAVRVRHTGTGKYTAELDGDGFNGLGYVQVTTKGAKPARCQNGGVRKGNGAVAIDLICHSISPGHLLSDTEWMLTYSERGSLNQGEGVPAAYVQTTFTPPGLKVDNDRSYNSTDGAMTILRDGIGAYRVGFKGVGIGGMVFQLQTMGQGVGQCNAGGWSIPAPGEVWVGVDCHNYTGAADLPFSIAIVRPPGKAEGTLNPTPPGPHPAGPKWAFGRSGLATNGIPLNVETELDPDEQWSTWVRNLDQVDARWARRATVIRDDVGQYRVRLPGVGSPVGIPQVTVSRMYTFSGNCVVRGYSQVGVDEEISVACFYGAQGHPVVPANLPFSVFFTAPPSAGAPAATIRYPVSTADTASSTGRPIRVERTGTGTYLATVDGSTFDARGHVQVTPFMPDTPAPVWCRATGTERTPTGMNIAIGCWDFGPLQAQPRDSQWLLTYTQDAPLTHDPAVPGAYLRTTLNPPGLKVDPDHSYSSTGGAMRVLRIDTGVYWAGFRAMGDGGNTFQISMVGPGAGQCLDGGSDHYLDVGVVWVQVHCFGAWRQPADLPFGVAVFRKPYGVLGSPNPAAPGSHPPAPRWGYAYMNVTNLAFGIETTLNPGYPWGSWLGTLDPFVARWWEPTMVTRESTGVSLMRLPRVGSATGIPHVTIAGSAVGSDACVVKDYAQDGVDELVRVHCFDKAGQPKDARFHIFFGAPATDGKPMVALRSDAPGNVRITQVGTGRYQATVDNAALEPTGYVQLTPLTGKAVRCRNAGVEKVGTALRIDVACDEVSAAAPPADSHWLLTYVRDTTLSHDTRLAGAYAQTTTGPGTLALDNSRSYNSAGGSITLTALGTGQYRMRFSGIGRPGDSGMVLGHSGQVVVRGQNAGSCYLPGLGHQDLYDNFRVIDAIVHCYDPSGKPADVPFGVAVVSRP